MCFEGTLYLARTGIPLRDLPGEFGAWDDVYQRFRRRVASGALARLFESRPPTRSSASFGGRS
jgi:transposase